MSPRYEIRRCADGSPTVYDLERRYHVAAYKTRAEAQGALTRLVRRDADRARRDALIVAHVEGNSRP